MRLTSTICSAALLAGLMALPAAAVQAAVQVWDFDNTTQAFNRNRNGNRLTLTSPDGVTLTVRGYADSRDRASGDTIQTGRLFWSSAGDSLAMRNRDEGGTSGHTIDSVSGDPSGEYEMLLLEFDEEVGIEGFDIDAAIGGSVANTADISVLAWDQTGSSALNGRTWDGILASNGGGYDVIGNYNSVGVNYFSVNNGPIRSTRWLIGVYNPLFGAGGSDGNDAFLLNALQTTNTAPGVASAPGSMALALMGLYGVHRSRKSR